MDLIKSDKSIGSIAVCCVFEIEGKTTTGFDGLFIDFCCRIPNTLLKQIHMLGKAVLRSHNQHRQLNRYKPCEYEGIYISDANRDSAETVCLSSQPSRAKSRRFYERFLSYPGASMMPIGIVYDIYFLGGRSTTEMGLRTRVRRQASRWECRVGRRQSNLGKVSVGVVPAVRNR